MFVGVGLPIIFVIIMAAIIFLSSAGLQPKENFIYTTEDNYAYGYEYRNTYKVVEGKIVVDSNEVVPNSGFSPKDRPQLFLYDFAEKESRKISEEEAQKLLINPERFSDDGYEVRYDYSHNGIFEIFGSGNNSNNIYLYKGSKKRELKGIPATRYRNDFRFIGWIIE